MWARMFVGGWGCVVVRGAWWSGVHGSQECMVVGGVW
jgi:hypothetical protein